MDRKPGCNTFARPVHLKSKSSSNFDRLLEVDKHDNSAQLFYMPTPDFNRQMARLLDLVEVLQCEMRDFKVYFTPFLNLYLVFTTTCYIYITTFLLVDKPSNLMEVLSSYSLGIIVMWNLFFSLCTGAICEQVWRKIYSKLLALMADESNLLDESLVRRMQLICVHLTKLENRAFVVLGNFPIDFSFLTTILGWIITGNLIVKRFVT